MADISTGLMKKTKAQLIEIILRKDEVERECRTEISNLNKKIKDYDADIKSITEQLKEDKDVIYKQASMIIEKENLIEDMKSQFDISATDVAEAKEAINIYKRYIRALSIACATLVFVLMNILFVF